VGWRLGILNFKMSHGDARRRPCHAAHPFVST
jgi:hypothetical protein